MESNITNFKFMIKKAKEKHKFTLGIFYRTQRPIYHKELYGDYSHITNRLSRDTRLDKIRKIFESK